ncbi:MAG TPA: hypothetical protein VFE63_12010 [Roseiarcus sp.]|nr:hypothetical protein [Roseiarcus sp.]
MDEWDGDAASLLEPYLQGKLTIGDLLAPFNEHRIFFTRLLVLSIFHISGYWDVVLQMIVNAVLDSVTVVAICFALSRVLPGAWAIAAMILSVLINAVPFGYENALLGFNTHFYLLLAFSFSSLWLLFDAGAWSSRWAAGILCGVGSFLCMASGALTLAAAIAAHVLQMAYGRRRGLREWLGVAALAAVAVALVSMVPHIPSSDAYRAHSVGQFLSALLKLASWPAHGYIGLILLAPSALFCLRALVDRPLLGDVRWFNVVSFIWVLSQILALAAGRAHFPLQSRYSDTLLIGLTISLVSAFSLFRWKATERKRMIWRSLALAGWLAVFILSLANPLHDLRWFIDLRRHVAETEAKNLTGYLTTGDASFLAGAPALEIPYSESSQLRKLLDTPEIRSALPPALLSRDPPRQWVEALKRVLLRLDFVSLGLGVLLLVAVVAWGALRPAINGARRRDAVVSS